MPIKGVTDSRVSFRRIAIIHKGGPRYQVPSKKHPGEMVWRMGDDLDHFRFTSEDPEIMQRWLEIYPDNQPRSIRVQFLFPTAAENFDAWMKENGAGGLKVKCNKENIVLRQENGFFKDTIEPCKFPNCACKPAGILRVLIPELGMLGETWVLTSSWNDCVELSANLAAVESKVRLMGKTLVGIPFVLSRVEREVSTPPRNGNDNRQRVKKWLMALEVDREYVGLQLEAARQMALPQLSAAEPLQLSEMDKFAPDIEDGEFEENGEAETPAPEPAPEAPKAEAPKGQNGNSGKVAPTRPFAPDVVRKGIQDRAAPNTRPAPEANRISTVRSLSKVVVGGDDARYNLTQYLIGKKHSADFTAGECNALIAWVGATKANDWQPNGYAIEEAKAILALVAAEQGVQLELPAEVEAAFDAALVDKEAAQ